MPQIRIFPLGVTQALSHTAQILQRRGFSVASAPGPDVTHLLLDIPSLRPLPHPELHSALEQMSPDCTILGGKLDHPVFQGHPCIDLLKREDYLAPNAAITAHCALSAALPRIKTVLPDTKALIIGWGRIGKCLARLLRNLDCPVTVALRSDQDRNLLTALGYRAIPIHQIQPGEYDLIFNTVPQPLLSAAALDVHPETLILDLASAPGLSGANVKPERGLPGRLAPQSSGALIAQTVITILKEDSL